MLIAVGNLAENGLIEKKTREGEEREREREKEKIKTETNDTLCFVVKLFLLLLHMFGAMLLFAFVAVNLVRSFRRERYCKRNGEKSSAFGKRVPRTILSANDLKFITKFRATIFSSKTFSTKINELTFHC